MEAQPPLHTNYPDLHQRTLAIHTIDATGTLVRKANLYLEYISEGRVGQLDDLNHRDGQVGLTDVKSANDFSGTRASWRTRQIGNVVAVEDDSKNRGHDPHGNDVRRCRATDVALRGFK